MKGNFDLEGSLTIIKGSTERLVVQMTNKAIEIGGTNGILPEEMKISSETEIVTNVTNTKYSDRDKSSGIILRIQVKSSSEPIPEEKIREEAGIPAKEKITIVKAGGIYKYQVGAFADYDKAAEMLKALKENGIRDAFIVAFRGSEQIPVSHVRSKK